MNLVLLSINNTRSRLLSAQGEDVGEWRDLWAGATPDLGPAHLAQALARSGIAAASHALVLSSVVPAVVERLAPVLAEFRVIRISAELRLNFSLGDYAGRATLGADRIADLAAAADGYALPAVILDLGTAITVDALDAERRYLGGMIAPGLRMFTEYLAEKTAQLPRLEAPVEPPSALGQNTEGAIRSGAFYGYAGQCQGLLEAACRAVPGEGVQSVIVTGGDAALFHSSLAWPGAAVHSVPRLALAGMRLLGRLNLPTSS